MDSVSPVIKTETRLAMTSKMPRKKWVIDNKRRNKYMSSHRDVGDVYDSSGVTFLKDNDIPIPKARSRYTKTDLFNDQFFNYWKDQKCKFNKGAFAYANRRLKRSYSSIKNLEVSDLNDPAMDILRDVKKRSASSGLPFLLSKSKSMEKDLNVAKALSSGRVAPPPAVGYYRTQADKVRLVWGYPLSMILIEGTYMLPIEKALRSHELPFVYGYSSSGIQGRLACIGYEPIQYCLDWSKFDSTLPRVVIHQCFNIVRSWFTSVNKETWNLVERYFTTCPILMPDGFIYHGRKKGVPSGSWFTQLIGSMANQWLVSYIAYVTGDHINSEVYMGDDSVLGMERMPTVQRWVRVAMEVGMTINPAKQVVTHGEPHFLKHYWGGMFTRRPVRETVERLVTSERWKKFETKDEYLDYTVDKAKSLLVDNVAAFDLLSKYIAWRFRKPLPMVRIRMAAGDLVTGSNLRRGWGEADTKLPVGVSREGFTRTLGEQMFDH